MKRYWLAVVIAVVIVAGAIAWGLRDKPGPVREAERARFIELSDRQATYERMEADPDLKRRMPPQRPLTFEEKAELEELRRRVGQWRADHPR